MEKVFCWICKFHKSNEWGADLCKKTKWAEDECVAPRISFKTCHSKNEKNDCKDFIKTRNPFILFFWWL